MSFQGLVTSGFGLVMALGLSGCKEPPTLSQVEQQIFSRSCVFSSCHGGTNPKAGLDLSSLAFEHLVNAKSLQVPSKMRVAPSDPDNSFLLEKLTSAKPTGGGSRMPPANDPLPDEEIELIREWIASGAQDN